MTWQVNDNARRHFGAGVRQAQPQPTPRKARAMRKGHIIFYDDRTIKQPRRRGCVTYHIHHERPFENGGEVGAWWAALVTAESNAFVVGPFATEVEAERSARHAAVKWKPEAGHSLRQAVTSDRRLFSALASENPTLMLSPSRPGPARGDLSMSARDERHRG
jgi:hypothetical protein